MIGFEFPTNWNWSILFQISISMRASLMLMVNSDLITCQQLSIKRNKRTHKDDIKKLKIIKNQKTIGKKDEDGQRGTDEIKRVIK